jgi:hypothetical protein
MEKVSVSAGKSSSSAPKYGSTGGHTGKKYIIDAGMPVETMIQLDASGAVLVFETTTRFIALPEEIIGQLSSENRLRYAHAKEFHDTWRGEEHDELVNELQVGKQFSGSASEKLSFTAPKNMVVRWTRKDRVPGRTAKGWRVLGADEITSFLGPTGSHHEIGQLGQTELVAMGIPKEIYDKSQKAKVRRNIQMAGSWETSGLSELQRAGGNPFVANDDDIDRKHNWSPVAQDEE